LAAAPPSAPAVAPAVVAVVVAHDPGPWFEEAKGTLEVLGNLVGERVKLVEERISAALSR
jgi:hypothetical protein